MVDVTQHVVARRIGQAIGQELRAEVEPRDAAAIGQLAQLPVGQVARMPAHGARVRVRGGERAPRRCAHILEPRVVEVRHVHDDAAALQLAHA